MILVRLVLRRAVCAYNASYTGLLVQQLFSVKYNSPPYAAFYPDIVTTLQVGGQGRTGDGRVAHPL